VALEPFLLIPTCLLIGVLGRRLQRVPSDAGATLNAYVVHVALPALTLRNVHGLRPERALLVPALMPWIALGAGFVFFVACGKVLRLRRATTGALILVGALGNTSFVGLPMIEAFYGREYLGTGVIIDQLGSYLALSTVGLFVAARFAAGQRLSARATVGRVLRFPPFVALVIALATTPWPYPDALNAMLARLAATLVPLSLIAIGCQLRVGQLRSRAGTLGLGLLFKLLIAPALVLALWRVMSLGRLPELRVTVFEAAMPPMIGATIIALEYGLDPDLASLLAGVGIPLSFATLPLWYLALRHVP
jgi:malate permease and related proteins